MKNIIITIQLCHCSIKLAIDSAQMNGLHSNKTLFTKVGFIFWTFLYGLVF